jgi:hypothetical protein
MAPSVNSTYAPGALVGSAIAGGVAAGPEGVLLGGGDAADDVGGAVAVVSGPVADAQLASVITTARARVAVATPRIFMSTPSTRSSLNLLPRYLSPRCVSGSQTHPSPDRKGRERQGVVTTVCRADAGR